MKKKLTALLILTALAVSVISGCSSSNQAAANNSSDTSANAAESKDDSAGKEAEATAKKKYKIGFTADHTGDFMALVVDGCQAASDELGVELTVQDADYDTAEQLRHVENYINSGVDAVVVKTVDTSACQPMKKACEEAGIPFVCVNNGSDAGCDCYVGSDDTYGGQLQGEFAREHMPDGGNVAFLMGDATVISAVKRTDGAKEELAKNDKIEVITEQEASWTRDAAMTTTENWLNSGMQIDCIIANNDEMAIGAEKVFEENGIEDVIICGVDGLDDALKLIKEGKMSMTVYQDGYMQGYTALKAAVDLIDGKKVDEYIDVPFLPITADNVDEYLNK